jgi:hypothetical protein
VTWLQRLQRLRSIRRIRRRRADRDAGNSILEVMVLGVLVMVPIAYFMFCLIRIQATTLAVNQAARDAGRAIEGDPSTAHGDRPKAVAEYALTDQGLTVKGLKIRFVAAGAGCDSPEREPDTAPGATYDICVRTTLQLPGLPDVLAGNNNTVTGVYTVHVGDLREGGR